MTVFVKSAALRFPPLSFVTMVVTKTVAVGSATVTFVLKLTASRQLSPS